MLLDVRTYTCRPGTIKKHIALYEKMGKGDYSCYGFGRWSPLRHTYLALV